MVRCAFVLFLAGLSVLVSVDRARASTPRHILVHANALLCKDLDSLDAAIAAWQERRLEVFRSYQESGACFLTKSTAKGTLLKEDGGRAAITIDFLMMTGQAIAVAPGIQLYAMVGTYSTWPQNWNTR